MFVGFWPVPGRISLVLSLQFAPHLGYGIPCTDSDLEMAKARVRHQWQGEVVEYIP